jgi:uncharacterized protein (TIRG00374 family)
MGWLLGIALIGAVVLVVRHFSEAEEFARLAEASQPVWLALAALLQAATYLAESAIWRTVVRAGGYALSAGRAYGLSVAKLFVDQTVPSGGISGTILYVQGLERLAIPRPIALAGVVVGTFSYYTAYASCLVIALVLAESSGRRVGIVASIGLMFLILSTVFAVVVLLQSGAAPGPIAKRLSRIRFVRRGLSLLQDADPRVAHDPRVLVRAILCELVIVLLDAGTIWAALRAVGSSAPMTAVFESFVLSSLFRTLSIVPGGLGTFEAASVYMLRTLGLPVSAALSATLIFRGLSFWLPMIPGMLCARRFAIRASKRAQPCEPR